ncbi:MAG TPA: serine hydrolase domain-containing protein [Gemmatimonas sp.]|uniref:serine hydrolase domain-containing protein n=1 Tax=Gemmatimonas sp. TaxID=1962908 RepID=UPI002EDABF92
MNTTRQYTTSHAPWRRRASVAVLVATALVQRVEAQSATSPYFPGATWERRKPEQVGMDPQRVQEAISHARANPSETLESKTAEDAVRSQLAFLKTFGEPPEGNEILGPMKAPKDVNGIIVRNGYIVAEFGDIKYVDLTASLSKSIVSTVAGVAYDRKLIPSLDARVGDVVRDGGYDSPHNAAITWRQMLQQTSEWEGTLWDKKDLYDRRTRRGGEPLRAPGAFWDYNDVRVNRLALSLLRVFNRPLPEVLKEQVMDPIGASSTWEWHGYRNSYVEIAGKRVQSVSGGAHWGGGFWSNAEDLARLGLLYARNGSWNGRQILSPAWIAEATTPARVTSTPPQTRYNYGFLFWLNADPRRPFAKTGSPKGYTMAGGGGYYTWMDPENDLVIVVKNLGGSMQQYGDFVSMVTSAIRK